MNDLQWFAWFMLIYKLIIYVLSIFLEISFYILEDFSSHRIMKYIHLLKIQVNLIITKMYKNNNFKKCFFRKNLQTMLWNTYIVWKFRLFRITYKFIREIIKKSKTKITRNFILVINFNIFQMPKYVKLKK